MRRTMRAASQATRLLWSYEWGVWSDRTQGSLSAAEAARVSHGGGIVIEKTSNWGSEIS